MKQVFQRFWWRMGRNKDPPIVERPLGWGVVVEWRRTREMHGYVLAWIMGAKSSCLLLVVQENTLTRLPCLVCAFNQNLPCSWAALPHQNKKFQLYRICAIGLQKDFLQKKKKSQLAVVTVLNSIKLSWSLLLTELARGVLQRRRSAPLLPSHILFQMIAWLLSAEPPTPLPGIPLLPGFL